jgi:hypothetical protein
VFFDEFEVLFVDSESVDVFGFGLVVFVVEAGP